uniref:Uncharacterized protein n=1 Tax=Timema tahoe TaxID=61484 RepID=A0A7R9IL96_9NEOP|nr:unnamed protein product [Timema tahoe]
MTGSAPAFTDRRVHGGPDVVDSLAHVRASKLLPRVEEILVSALQSLLIVCTPDCLQTFQSLLIVCTPDCYKHFSHYSLSAPLTATNISVTTHCLHTRLLQTFLELHEL